MYDWKKNALLQTKTIHDAIKIIDSNPIKIALIINNNNRLVGTVTDGDVRRGILKGVSIQEAVKKIMNACPTFIKKNEISESLLEAIKRKNINYIPVVDNKGCVMDLRVSDDIIQAYERDNWVVIMAGGIGTRLGHFTYKCPKPLLRVGDKPILESTIENFINYGFRRFFISVNYKADMIKKYFKDGSHLGITIRYLHESKMMGTAGSLSLISEKISRPLIIINGDVLTKVNYQHLLDFHQENRSKATMCVREYEHQIPFGVVKIRKCNLVFIEEKPVQRFFVNAGLYILEPEILRLIPRNSCLDMPDLFKKIKETKYKVAVFPLREYWIDIGRIDDFRQANEEFVEVIE